MQDLFCIECGARSEDGAGWRAEIAVDEEEPDEVVVYCPPCWEHEFGWSAPTPNSE